MGTKSRCYIDRRGDGSHFNGTSPLWDRHPEHQDHLQGVRLHPHRQWTHQIRFGRYLGKCVIENSFDSENNLENGFRLKSTINTILNKL